MRLVEPLDLNGICVLFSRAGIGELLVEIQSGTANVRPDFAAVMSSAPRHAMRLRGSELLVTGCCKLALDPAQLQLEPLMYGPR